MKKRVLVALCTAAGLMAPAGMAVMAPTTAYAATNPVLHVGSRGSAVQQLQRKLNALGFSVGAVDGDFGPRTDSAVKRFQGSRHLIEDGVVGPKTWGALNNSGSASGSTPSRPPTSASSSSAPHYPGRLIRYGIRGTDVKEVQSQLNKLGYNCGTADGVYGPHTYAGVRAFQRAHHLVQDGIVGPATWPVLFATSGSSTPPANTNSYTVYDYSGSNKGGYPSLSSAETAVHKYPAGVVKDNSGKIVYRQVGYFGYKDPADLVGVYPSWTTANAEAGSAGFVVNQYNEVDREPSNLYYSNGSTWTSTEYGPQGTQVPSEAKAGVSYIAVDVNPGHSPHNTEYYPFQQGTQKYGQYIGNAKASFTWENTYRTANLTLPSGQPPSGANIDNYIKSASPSSSLYGLGYSYMDAEKFGSNAVYLFSHSVIESGWGNSSISQNKNNLFGYGAYDSSPGNDAGAFPSDDYAIHFQSWFVRDSYLNKGSSHNTPLGPNLDGMSEGGYATDPNWSSSVATVINYYADKNGYSNSTTPITPITDKNGPGGNGEPVYLANDFKAKVPSFPGNLSYAPTVTNDSVKTLQDALNASGDGPLTVDGQFGPATESAVKKFQANVKLTQSGTVDQSTWSALFPPLASGFNSVSEIYMDYVNGLAISQVLTNTGQRVFEPYIHFTNVYRVEPAAGPAGPQAQIPVYVSEGGAEVSDTYGQVFLHAGDYVSNDNGGQVEADGKYVKVGFTEWRNGTPQTFNGYVLASSIQMPKDNAGANTMPTYNGLDPAAE